VLRVGQDVVTDERVNHTEHRVLHGSAGIEVPTVAYCTAWRVDEVRSIRSHDPIWLGMGTELRQEHKRHLQPCPRLENHRLKVPTVQVWTLSLIPVLFL
jgi:hypothetical protein